MAAESSRLLAGALPDNDVRLSRRRRFIPLAVDRDGDVAATMFLRRGVSGAPMLDVHLWERHADGWHYLGGGGGSASDIGTARPDAAAWGAPGWSPGFGGARGRPRPAGEAWWVGYAQIRLAREVTSLQVGTRQLPVAAHGIAVVVWRDEPPASVEAVDAGSHGLGQTRFLSQPWRPAASHEPMRTVGGDA